MDSKLKDLYKRLDQEIIEYHVSDHAIVQYLRRFNPDLKIELEKEIRTSNKIDRKISGDTITTVMKKR